MLLMLMNWNDPRWFTEHYGELLERERLERGCPRSDASARALLRAWRLGRIQIGSARNRGLPRRIISEQGAPRPALKTTVNVGISCRIFQAFSMCYESVGRGEGSF